MKKPSKAALQRVKSTLVGRLICRLVGEQTGAVMMEYVVVGVLVVAAAVAMVLVFGDQIRDSFHSMVLAIQGKQNTLTAHVNASNTANENAANAAEVTGETVSGNQ